MKAGKVHVIKNKAGKIEVVHVGANGQLLNHTNPQQFSRMRGAATNIAAVMRIHGNKIQRVQDDTGKESRCIEVFQDGSYQASAVLPGARYLQAWEKKKPKK